MGEKTLEQRARAFDTLFYIAASLADVRELIEEFHGPRPEANVA